MIEKLQIHQDERGKLIEIFKIPNIGQIFYSTTKPGFIRGNHYHTRKIEKFCVVEGKAKIKMRNRVTNEIKEYIMNGDNPEIIEIEPNWSHSIENIGNNEMKLIVWSNEIFNSNDPDTFAEEV